MSLCVCGRGEIVLLSLHVLLAVDESRGKGKRKLVYSNRRKEGMERDIGSRDCLLGINHMEYVQERA